MWAPHPFQPFAGVTGPPPDRGQLHDRLRHRPGGAGRRPGAAARPPSVEGLAAGSGRLLRRALDEGAGRARGWALHGEHPRWGKLFGLRNCPPGQYSKVFLSGGSFLRV